MARLKKKYGQDLESIKKFKAKLTSEYESLCSVDEKLPLVIQEKQAIDQQIKEQEMAIFQKRKDASSPFSRSVHQKLLDLNLECDAFVVEVEGDGVLFYLQMGEKKVSCSEEISGGELARVTLAIKTVLAENNLQAALFFDEIDAHIGGETARKMALVLKELGQYRQVISISHFPQVASLADSHIMVKKQGQKAFIMKLQDEQKSLEILRMMGGSHPLDKLEVDIWTGLNPG